jgi:ABC-type thiamine transport system ATPase subunit
VIGYVCYLGISGLEAVLKIDEPFCALDPRLTTNKNI